MDSNLTKIITEEIVRYFDNQGTLNTSPALSDFEVLKGPAFHFEDESAVERMKNKTTARIAVGRCGPRLTTATLLKLRADHAQARDAVFDDVPPELLDSMKMFSVTTKCDSKNTYITRPDLGRLLTDEAVNTVKSRCKSNIDVQIIAADGLSSTAIVANLPNILPVLTESLKAKNISVGDPFFVKYGRVACEDHVAEILNAKVVCILIGERPGLATAESMSAYLAYDAKVGMPESRRTVVSNIHKNGTAAVEAGAYIADLIEKILKEKASGVDLVN